MGDTDTATSTNQSPKKHSRGKRIALWIIGIVVGVIVVVLVGFNIYMRAAYSTFYSEAQAEFQIPGIHEGFVCQDLDHYQEGDCWFFSGYASSDGPSPLYRRAADGSATEFFAQLPDGSPYTDHGSAITTSADYAFLACEGGYLVFNVLDLASASSGEAVRAIDKVDLEITPAFMNIENGALFVGTFHLLPNYAAPDHHHLVTPDGSENAGLMLVYPAVSSAEQSDSSGGSSSTLSGDVARYGFASQAAAVYSLPDKVQGMCVLPNGEIVLSTSYGFAASHLLTYQVSSEDLFKSAQAVSTARGDGQAQTQGSEENDDAAPNEPAFAFFVEGQWTPLFYLDSTNLVSDVVAPPMTEGIEFDDGRVYISEESASNKYIFGKLYGAGEVYSMATEDLSGTAER